MQFYGFILDKVGILMVKYAQVNIAVNGKSTIVNPIESLGHRLQARAVSAVILLSWRVIELAEMAVALKFTGALPYLTAIITPAWAAFATILGFYFNKAKGENKEKIKASAQKRDA